MNKTLVVLCLCLSFLCAGLVFPSDYPFPDNNERKQNIRDELDNVEKEIDNALKEVRRIQNATGQDSFSYSEPESLSAGQSNISVYSDKEDNNKLDKGKYFSPGESALDVNSESKLLISGGGDLYYIHYREIMGGSTLDKDTGLSSGYYVDLSYSGSTYMDFVLGIPYIEAYFRYINGKSKYHGSTWGGTPAVFKENLEIERFGLRIGAKRNMSKWLIYGYFDVGRRIWVRGANEFIAGAWNYKEKYEWLYFGLGAGARRKIGRRIIVGIEGEFMLTPKGYRKMRAELYDGATFTLGGVWGGELKVPFCYLLTRRFSFDITPYYTFWHIGESDVKLITSGGVPVSYAQEPKSNTFVGGVLFGLTIALF